LANIIHYNLQRCEIYNYLIYSYYSYIERNYLLEFISSSGDHSQKNFRDHFSSESKIIHEKCTKVRDDHLIENLKMREI
jgi:hypothetical protein